MARLRTSATVSGRARPRGLITHCTELPTAIARTDSDWAQPGVRSPLRLRGADGQPANAEFLPHFAVIRAKT
jgi:hypothetical protein